MSEPIISQTFAGKTGAVVPDDFDEAFGDIVAKFDGGIDNANIAVNAGIDWRKLGQPYHVYEVPVTILADSAGSMPAGAYAPAASDGTTWISSPELFTINTGTARTVQKRFIRLDSNELLWLCELTLWAIDITVDAGSYPQVTVYKNGTLIPGATFTISEDDTSQPNEPLRLYRNNPIANPLISFAEDDVIEYRLGSSGGGSPTARGIFAQELWKRSPVR